MADARRFRKNMPVQVLRPECEACHMLSKNQPLSMMPVGATSSFEDGYHDDEDAADGILVVQVCRLRTVPGEIFEPARGQAHLAAL